MHARFYDHAGSPERLRWRTQTSCLPLHRQRRHPDTVFYRGSMAGLHNTPADASPTPSRTPAHGLGSMWFAIPSSQGTCTPYSLPVSRRTCVKTHNLRLAQRLFPTRVWLFRN